MIKGIHHVQICIPKGFEDQAKAFYCGILGLEELQKPKNLAGRGGFWVKVGDRELHIGTEDGVDRTRTKAHVAYEVEDLQEIRDILSRNHIEQIKSVPIPGYERFEIRDPFGNRVEFIKSVN